MFRRGKYQVNKRITSMLPWESVKSNYDSSKYIYLDSTTSDRKECKRVDETNRKIYHKRVQATSVVKEVGHEISIPPPPRPTNVERLNFFEKWMAKKPALEISLAAVELFRMYRKVPCIDYPPDEAVEFLQKLDQESVPPSAPMTPPMYVEYPELDIVDNKEIV